MVNIEHSNSLTCLYGQVSFCRGISILHLFYGAFILIWHTLLNSCTKKIRSIIWVWIWLKSESWQLDAAISMQWVLKEKKSLMCNWGWERSKKKRRKKNHKANLEDFSKTKQTDPPGTSSGSKWLASSSVVSSSTVSVWVPSRFCRALCAMVRNAWSRRSALFEVSRQLIWVHSPKEASSAFFLLAN